MTDAAGQKPDAWRAHRACLESLPPEATHLLVLQDDALPIPSFLARTKDALKLHPESILLLFVPGFKYLRLEMHDASRRGDKTMTFIPRVFVPTVAIIYPREVVTHLLSWVDGRKWPLRGADDGIVADYCRKHRIYPRAVVPCICDHDEHVPSVTKQHRPPGEHRRAAMI